MLPFGGVQVFVGKWKETQVAVKLLFDPGSAGTTGGMDIAVEQMLSEDNPMLASVAQASNPFWDDLCPWVSRPPTHPPTHTPTHTHSPSAFALPALN
jgi:hypothetical protein